jgi:hypothetical protein
MDVTLLIISVLALLMATTMSLVAWRMLRDERLRSAARVAALAADIRQETVAARTTSNPPEPAGPAVGSTTSRPGPIGPGVAVPRPADDLGLHDAGGAAPADMFASTQRAPSRLTLAASAIALVAAGATAATILAGGSGRADTIGSASQTGVRQRPSTASTNPATTGAAVPLELVALGHERDSDGLIVRGVLRNPPSGPEISHLTAVVLLFNREGAYIASGRAEVQPSTLGPGRETTFVVAVPGAPGVERYRVSFRTERDVVPHVDLRTQKLEVRS